MPRTKSVNGSPNSGGAVLVSYNLQLAVVATAFLTIAVQALFFVSIYVTNDNGFSMSYALQSIAMSFMPILFFAVAYLTSIQYPRHVNRLFVSVIKALVYLLLFGIFESIKNQLSFFMKSPADGLPPQWSTSFATVCAIWIFCLLLMLAVEFRRIRR